MDNLHSQEREFISKGANERQHGGEHYKQSAGLQHWDFVKLAGLDYYSGNATKYLSRYPHKNGYEDLQKAAHYCEKALEFYPVQHDQVPSDLENLIHRFTADNSVGYDAYCAIRLICFGRYKEALPLINKIMQDTPQGAGGTRLG